MKKLLTLISCVLLGFYATSLGQPTDNPVSSQYGAGHYPAWVDGIQWDNVIDVTSDAALSQVAVPDDDTKGAQNFTAFEEARDILYAEGGGVLYFPAGTYHFSLPDMGYGDGIGPLSRGLMLKKGIVIRGDTPSAANAIVRNPSEKLDTDHDLQPTTIFQFPFQTRGTVPASATGVNGEAAGTADAAGEVPTDWNIIGMTPGTNETGVSDVDDVGIVNVALVGGTIVFGFDTDWATHMGADGAKWEAANFKVDWPAGSAANSEDWINRVPNGEHYMDLINGRSGWTKQVISGSGRLVMNVKIIDGAPWNDMMYADRKTSSTTAMPTDAFAHYRFAGRVIAYGSNVFIANNVIAKPTRNFVHNQKQDVGDRDILFDYANHLGVDVNKSLLGGNQGHPSVHVIDGDGYYASNIVIKDNWVFNRGNKGFEVSGHHVVIQNNHNERYVAANRFPYEYITNPEAYPLSIEGGDIDAGGISFDGFVWQSSESSDDYLSRGIDLGGMDVWVDNCTVINTGSRGNDGEAILGQRHNNIETLSWSITNSKFGPYTIDDTPSSSNGANSGYIGPYDMHSIGLFLTGNEGPGGIGLQKPANNYMLDGTWFNNSGGQNTPATGRSSGNDDWLAPGKASAPHTDPVTAPALSGEMHTSGNGFVLTWTDNANNEHGFRVDRSINAGAWETISYRPRASVDGATAFPDGNIASAQSQFDVGDVVQTQWTDYLMPTSGSVDYRVVAINANDDDSTGVSNTVSLVGEFNSLEQSFDDLTAGEISGQGNWSIDAADSAKATVETGALTYTAADGAILDGGTQHLALTGAPDAKMNNWLQLGIDPPLDGTTYVRALISSSDKGIDTDRGELFMRVAGWNLYVAAKFYDGIIEMPGGNTLEVDTTNGLPLDVTHMVLLKLNVESGVVTSADLWLNPEFADEASPDLSASGLTVDLSSITTLELRSQNTLTRVDELLLAESWAEVVPEYVAPPFDSLSASFDDLTAGEISGQGNWSIDAADSAKATVETGALTYTAADGAILDGGTQHLALTGAPDAKMNNWLQLGIDPPLDGTTYVRALISSSDKGIDTDRGELFLRVAGWNLYVAAKFYDGIIEMPGGNTLEVDTTNGLPLDVTHMVLLKLNVESGVVTSADLWLNPEFADEASPDLSASGLTVDLSSITTLELRSQNTLTRVDELLLAESWAEVVPEAFTSLSASFDGLNIGSIDGQGAWNIDDADAGKVNVASGSLTYTAPDGAELGGGSQHLVLSGSPDAKMNNWLQLAIDPPLTGSTYVRALIRSGDKGTSTDAGEFFMRLAGWNLYVAAKFYDGIIEMPGGNTLEVDTTNGLPLDVTHMVLLKLNVESGVVTSVDLWLNPTSDDEASPDLTASGLTVDLSSVTTLELRSQNTVTLVDEILFSPVWDGLVPEATVATPPSILSDPASVSVETGALVEFTVSAAGTAPLSYQWRKDSVEITGATDTTYSIAAAQLDDAGDYDVVVTNSAGSATSSVAALVVIEPVVSNLESLFLETFDSGTTSENAASVDITSLGWNFHHSYAGVYMPGLATGADAPNDFLSVETSTQIGDPDKGELYGYQAFFTNNFPLHGQGEEGARPASPGPHPDTGSYYSNRTLAHFLWTEATISSDDRARLAEFNFVQGNRDASEHSFFPAVRIDGQWFVYVVSQEFLGTDVRILGRPGQSDPNGAETVFSSDQFSESGEYANYFNAQPYSFAWSEGGWTPLTFDGTAGTNSTVGMTLGTPLAGDLPAGEISALGVYAPEKIDPGYNFNGFRIDSIEVLADAPAATDLFTFTFNNEGTVNGSDRPIQAANWDGVYSSAALPLVTGDPILADLSEGVSSDDTPGHYKAGFLFVAGKDGQPAPEGFLAYSTNTNVVDSVQSNPEGVNPQTDWYSDPFNSVTDLSELSLSDVQEMQMRIRPRNASIRFHFAIQVDGEWYVSEDSFQHSGTNLGSWESVSLSVPSANWLSGVVGASSVNFDFVANAPTVTTVDGIGGDMLIDTVGIYIDTDDLAGSADAWARVDSITLSAVVPDIPAPVITTQPAAVGAIEGESAEFSVVVEDTTGVTYQWRKDGVDIAGATGSTLALSGVSSADAGDYDVVISGPGGAITSDAASLEVFLPPTVSPVTLDLDATEQDQLITVTANSAIDWTATTTDDWISINFGASGSGGGLVGITVASNDSFDARSGSLTIAGNTVAVAQAGIVLPATFAELVGAVDNQDGSFTSTWFGTYTSPATDWIRHEESGWLYTGHAAYEGDMLMYGFPLNSWIWTSVDIWPRAYEFETEAWIYFIVVDGQAYVYDYATETWSF